MLIAARIDLVFDLVRDVQVHTRGLAHIRERVAPPGVTQGLLKAGDIVSFRSWHFGLPWRYDARVVVCEPPTRLVGVQEVGPFRSMRHETRLVQTGAGTLLLDELSWRSGLWPLGPAVDALLLRRYLRRLLRVRDAHLRMVAEQLSGDAERTYPQPPLAVHIPPPPPSLTLSHTEESEAGAPPGRGNFGLPAARSTALGGAAPGGAAPAGLAADAPADTATGGPVGAAVGAVADTVTGAVGETETPAPVTVTGTPTGAAESGTAESAVAAGAAAPGTAADAATDATSPDTASAPSPDAPAAATATPTHPKANGPVTNRTPCAPREPRVVVAVALLDDQGRVLAAERRSGGWELPGGKVEPGESPEAALVRECREELGVEIVLTGRLHGEQPMAAGRPDGGAVLRAWTGRVARGEPAPVVHRRLRWLPPDRIGEVDWLAADRPFVAQLAARSGQPPA